MMNAIECPSNSQLRDLSLGRLPFEESDDLLTHVSECAVCRAEIETVDDGQDSLIASLRGPGDLDGFQHEPACDLALAKSLGALVEGAESYAEPSLPQQIGEYQILRRLGQGGMGIVFLARHMKLGREVALKVLAHHRLGDPRLAERFETEMRAIGRLSHPNIVAAHDAREIDGTAVLVTEFIDGFDLGELVKRTGPLSIAAASEIIRQTAVALQYTKSQGYVHRDVKPSNIMLGREGQVKLLDLGLARLQRSDADLADMTGTGQAIGTADFIAPEQVTDSRSVDVRADIYSLGCTLFKLLTGVAPFADDQRVSAFAKMTAHVSAPAPSLSSFRSDVPSKLDSLTEAMLAKDVDARPQSPGEVASRLSEFARGHDLAGWVAKAEQAEPEVLAVGNGHYASGKPSPEATLSAKRTTQPVLRRSVPIHWVIATGIMAGIMAGVIGFVLGLVVKITYPDGTTMSLNVPAGSNVEVTSDDGDSSKPPATGSQHTPGAPVAVRDVQEHLQGKWSVLEALDGGRPGDVEGLHMTFQGNSFSLDNEPDRDHREAGTFSVGRPLQGGGYEFALTNQRSGETKAARLRFMGPGLIQICLNERDGKRPTRFESVPNSVNDVLITLARGDREKVSGFLKTVPPESDSRHKVDKLREAATVQMKQLLLAMVIYESTHGHFPASHRVEQRAGKSTEPYSWRVAILPFIEGHALYHHYRFDEPWDSEHNRTLLEQMPDVFRSPFATPDQQPGQTNYLGFVGDRTALGRERGVPLKAIQDGTSNTVLIVETAAAVPWTKPADLPFLDAEDARKAVPFGREPIRYGTADGTVRSISPNDWRELAKQITRDGGEQIDWRP